MGFNDWSEYNSNKQKVAPSGKTVRSGNQSSYRKNNGEHQRVTYSPSQKSARNVSKTTNNNSRQQPTSRKPKRNSKAVIKKRKRRLKRIGAGFLALLTTGLVYLCVAKELDKNKVADSNIGREVLITAPSNIDAPIEQPEGYSYEDLLEYEKFCYVGEYGGEEYWFATEDYLRDVFDCAMERVETLYANSSKVGCLDNGRYVGDCITADNVLAMIFRESSWRICHADGQPLLAYDKHDVTSDEALKYAGGIAQQKVGFVETADMVSRSLGGDGYSVEDRYNPVTAVEMAILNLNRMYRSYLAPGQETHRHLCPDMYDTEGNYIGSSSRHMAEENDYVVMSALYMAYHDGEGAVARIAREDNLRERILDKEDTKYAGLKYYRSVFDHAERLCGGEDYEIAR